MGIARFNQQQLLLLEKILEKLDDMREILNGMEQNSNRMKESLTQGDDWEDEEEESVEDGAEDTANEENIPTEVEEIVHTIPEDLREIVLDHNKILNENTVVTVENAMEIDQLIVVTTGVYSKKIFLLPSHVQPQIPNPKIMLFKGKKRISENLTPSTSIFGRLVTGLWIFDPGIHAGYFSITRVHPLSHSVYYADTKAFVTGIHPKPCSKEVVNAPIVEAVNDLKLFKMLETHGDRVWSLAWDPTVGTPLVFAPCSSDKAVRIWEHTPSPSATWTCKAILEDTHTRTVCSCAKSPLKKLLATVSFDATISNWENVDGDYEGLSTLKGHENATKRLNHNSLFVNLAANQDLLGFRRCLWRRRETMLPQRQAEETFSHPRLLSVILLQDGRDTIWPLDFHTGWSYGISIPSWIFLSRSRGSDPVVFYRIQVGTPEGINTIRGILRGFNDFLKLFSEVKKAFPSKYLPPALPKNMLKIKSRTLLEERRCFLEDWRGKLFSDIDVSRSAPVPTLREFEAVARSSFYDENQQTPDVNSSTSGVLQKKDGIDQVPFDKRRKIGLGRTVGPASTGRMRQPFAVVNSRQDGTGNSDMGSAEGSECGTVEFTKEEVEALLNVKFKGKQFDFKGKLEQMTEHIKRLKLCIKWFQQTEENHVLEKEKLQSVMESVEKKCMDTEVEMKSKVEEFNLIISDLKKTVSSLEERVAKEESDKLDAIECHRKEKEARVNGEKLQALLSSDLEKARQEDSAAEQKAASFEDMYKRAQEYNVSLQQYNSKLQKDNETHSESLKRVEMEKLTIVENLSNLRCHKKALQDQLTSFKASQDEFIKQKESLSNELRCLRGELQQVRHDRDHQVTKVQALTAEVVKYEEFTGKSVVELDNLTIKSNALEETCSSQREQIRILQQQLAAANEKLKMVDLSASETRAEYEEQKRIVQELHDRLADTELQLSEGEKLRKKLHNTILELKGNIRVFCRVRPLLPDDGVATETAVIAYPTSTEALGRGIDLMQSGQKYPFTFDKVFTHEASQQDVFVEISQLVQSALDGYKVCIFAYGQTGSGKTYTMMGRPETSEQKGLIPRSLEQIFQASQFLQVQGWKYKMQASMLEIYNETVRDLLSTNRSNGLDMSRTENGVQGKQYTIKHDANGNTHVSDLTVVDVCSIKEISSLLQQAAKSRSVGKTQMNEQSSRSHFVFTLRISGVNESTEQQVQGVLNLIDLAGSERLSKSGSTGDRLKETQAINKSLSCLADVIFALAKREDHVPFRNSKLTYLLQPCLGGDSKTLMFVNVSPDPSSIGESLCSLRFAARVNACEIGIPRRQTTTVRPSDSRLSYG